MYYIVSKSWKMMLWKCYTQYASKFGKLSSAHRTGKCQFHSNPKERQCQRMLKLPRNWLISHTSEVMLKILKVRLQQYMNWELPDVEAGFRKLRRTRDQTANIHRIIDKAREFPPKIHFCFMSYARAFDYVDHNKLRKIPQEMGIPEAP